MRNKESTHKESKMLLQKLWGKNFENGKKIVANHLTSDEYKVFRNKCSRFNGNIFSRNENIAK